MKMCTNSAISCTEHGGVAVVGCSSVREVEQQDDLLINLVIDRAGHLLASADACLHQTQRHVHYLHLMHHRSTTIGQSDCNEKQLQQSCPLFNMLQHLTFNQQESLGFGGGFGESHEQMLHVPYVRSVLVLKARGAMYMTDVGKVISICSFNLVQ